MTDPDLIRVGNRVRVWGPFEVKVNDEWTLTDPTTVTLKVKAPSGTVTTYTYAGGTVSKDSTGLYYRDVEPDAAGVWRYLWEGTGAVDAVYVGKFTITATGF